MEVDKDCSYVVLQGNYTRITLREDLYLGGYRGMEKVSGRVGTHHPFTGCVEELWVNSYKYDMRRAGKVGDAINGLNIGKSDLGRLYKTYDNI